MGSWYVCASHNLVSPLHVSGVSSADKALQSTPGLTMALTYVLQGAPTPTLPQTAKPGFEESLAPVLRCTSREVAVGPWPWYTCWGPGSSTHGWFGWTFVSSYCKMVYVSSFLIPLFPYAFFFSSYSKHHSGRSQCFPVVRSAEPVWFS